MDFRDLQHALIAEIRERVRSGEFSERGLARLTEISQPHLHNVLKGKRILSVEKANTILHQLGIDVRDLVALLESGTRPRR